MVLKTKTTSSCPSPGNQDAENLTKKLPYPRAVFFIVVTEFCERFSYYGMRAVLTLYMANILHFSDDLSTTVYHVYLFLSYFLPLFGGILADSFLGKYKTVLVLSTIFAIGNALLTSSAIPPLHLPSVAFSLAGLLLMAIGTGGIKPCVVALGGDQFHSVFQERQLKQFFSIFFFAISIGNMLSTFLAPILRSNVQCFGDDSCYSLAFGIPASLMLVAIVIFALGKPLYKINKPTENIILRVIQCITHALSQRRKEKLKGIENEDKKKHWIDYAHYEGSKFDQQLVQDTKGLMRILVYYIPIPMFWALYEQLGSRWTLQATHMDGYVGFTTLKADQMQVANAILMFTFIPVSETILYPLLRKCNIFKRPLQRMSIGGILAAISFILAGTLQMNIEKNTLQFSSGLNETHLNIINTLSCPVSITTVEGSKSSLTNETLDMYESHIVSPEDNLVLRSITQGNVKPSISVTLSDFSPCLLNHGGPSSDTFKSVQLPSHTLSHLINETLTFRSPLYPSTPGQIQYVIMVQVNNSMQIYALKQPQPNFDKSRYATELTILNLKDEDGKTKDIQTAQRMKLVSKNGNVEYFPLDLTNKTMAGDSLYKLSLPVPVPAGWYSVHLESSSSQSVELSNSSQWKEFYRTEMLKFENTASYLLLPFKDQLVVLIPPRIHMLWVLPQYIVMAWAEVLFIISGMEFSYSEAPVSMKSVLQACWHLTNAAGNLMVIIAAQIHNHHSQATEFLIFAALMGVDIIIFSFMAAKYKYVSPESQEKYDDEFDELNFNNKGMNEHSRTCENSNKQNTRL